MEDIKKHQRSITLTHICELLYKEVEPGLTVYRLTNSATAGGAKVAKAFASRVETYTTEGVAETKHVVAYEEGRSAGISKLDGNPVIVSESFLEDARTKGYHEASKELGKALRQDYYTALVEEGVSLERLVHIDYGNYLLHDRRHGVLPVARYFNYMHGDVHNGRYDLDKALEVLRTIPGVRFVLHDRWDKGEADSILRIPYYNCNESHQTHLSFWFSPTLEQEQAIWAKQQSYRAQYPSTQWYRAVNDLDLLGLNAAGARLPETISADD